MRVLVKKSFKFEDNNYNGRVTFNKDPTSSGIVAMVSFYPLIQWNDDAEQPSEEPTHWVDDLPLLGKMVGEAELVGGCRWACGLGMHPSCMHHFPRVMLVVSPDLIWGGISFLTRSARAWAQHLLFSFLGDLSVLPVRVVWVRKPRHAWWWLNQPYIRPKMIGAHILPSGFCFNSGVNCVGYYLENWTFQELKLRVLPGLAFPVNE